MTAAECPGSAAKVFSMAQTGIPAVPVEREFSAAQSAGVFRMLAVTHGGGMRPR